MFKSASDNCCIVKCSSEIINEFANGLKQYYTSYAAICNLQTKKFGLYCLLLLLDRIVLYVYYQEILLSRHSKYHSAYSEAVGQFYCVLLPALVLHLFFKYQIKG